ncbi:MBL fold metallo-hydrolase [Mycobacterium vulneris]|nr:MBL fold metallo-hydrolase [Mycolicibacterium vulneris]
MKVYHFNCGTLPFGMITHCLLVETAHSLVLVDTGFGLNCVRRPRQVLGWSHYLLRPRLAERETAIRQVEALGFSPKDVQHILLTHLDYDHAGGIADFPWATVHVHGPEFRAAMNPTARERLKYRRPQWAHGPRWAVNDLAGSQRWFGFEAVCDLAGLPSEILVVPLGGHTRGHAGVAIDTGGGWLLHAGDAVYSAGQFDPESPDITTSVRVGQILGSADESQRLANQRRLAELHANHSDDVTVFCAHDADAFARLVS